VDLYLHLTPHAGYFSLLVRSFLHEHSKTTQENLTWLVFASLFVRDIYQACRIQKYYDLQKMVDSPQDSAYTLDCDVDQTSDAVSSLHASFVPANQSGYCLSETDSPQKVDRSKDIAVAHFFSNDPG